MKLLFIIALFFNLYGLSQENPWENKGENPWGNYPTEEPKSNIVAIDTLEQTAVHDSTALLQQPDSSSAQLDEMVRSAELDTKENYKAGKDFAFGLASGLLLNGYGTLADLIYTIPTTKSEKKAMEKVRADSVYSNINEERLNNRTKRAVKSKKFLSALGGTIVGSVIQLGALIGYSIYA